MAISQIMPFFPFAPLIALLLSCKLSSCITPSYKLAAAKENHVMGYVATPDGSLLKDVSGKVSMVSTNMPGDPNDPNRKNDILPYTGRSESADIKKPSKK